MINYQVYAVKKREVEWKITLNIMIDSAYWHQEGFSEIFVYSSKLSIGHAMYLLNCLQQNSDKKNCDSVVTSNNLIPAATKPGFNKYLEQYWQYKTSLLNLFEGKILLYDEVANFLDREGNGFDHKFFQDILQVGYLLNDIKVTSAVSYPERDGKYLICHRCGSTENVFIEECQACQDKCATCEECITLGRSKTCNPLLHFSLESISKKRNLSLEDTFTDKDNNLMFQYLTPFQQEVANRAIQFLNEENEKDLLIWAVTGSGKTEMIFPAVFSALQENKRILFTSPRKDVIKELMPRFKHTFSKTSIVSLYGGSLDRWEKGSIYLSTTHQTIRFAEYFDLVIIDEMDAFPYHNNKMLQFAVKRALKPGGKMIYLTATPSRDWLEKIKKKDLRYIILPVRHHGNPLTVPFFDMIPKKTELFKSRKPNKLIYNFFIKVKGLNGQAFIFVPEIKYLKVWTQVLKSWFINDTIEGVYANDRRRNQKTEDFKSGKIQFLVTTTIMERGVTVPNVHVLVIGAESKIFDEATLIQIMGRVGRSKEFPEGLVWFLAEYNTKGITGAKKYSNKMNKLAKKLTKGKIKIDNICY